MKASVFIAASIDGYIAREDGDIDWLHNSGSGEVAEGEDYGYKEFANTIDVLVMGRHSFEKVLTFGDWPYQDKPVVVLSHSLSNIPVQLPDTVELCTLEPADLLQHLEQRGFKHAYIDGGVTIQRFLCAGLINEITITRIPRILGGGIPLFENGGQDTLLNHLETKTFADGLVQSKYQVRTVA